MLRSCDAGPAAAEAKYADSGSPGDFAAISLARKQRQEYQREERANDKNGPEIQAEAGATDCRNQLDGWAPIFC